MTTSLSRSTATDRCASPPVLGTLRGANNVTSVLASGQKACAHAIFCSSQRRQLSTARSVIDSLRRNRCGNFEAASDLWLPLSSACCSSFLRCPAKRTSWLARVLQCAYSSSKAVQAHWRRGRKVGMMAGLIGDLMKVWQRRMMMMMQHQLQAADRHGGGGDPQCLSVVCDRACRRAQLLNFWSQVMLL